MLPESSFDQYNSRLAKFLASAGDFPPILPTTIQLAARGKMVREMGEVISIGPMLLSPFRLDREVASSHQTMTQYLPRTLWLNYGVLGER